MTFIEEARKRWGAGTPPFFKKAQKFALAAGAFGTGLAGVGWVGKFTILGLIGGGIAAFSTGFGLLAQFVVTSLGIILEPGESIENKTSQTIEVNASQSPEPEAATADKQL